MRQEKIARVRINVERIFLESEKLLIHSPIPCVLPANHNRGKSPPNIRTRACLLDRAQMPVNSHTKRLLKTDSPAVRHRAGQCALMLEAIVKAKRGVLSKPLS